MAYKKRISRSQRRHMDYLRLEGLKVGKVYQNRLIKLRRAEVKRVLEQCKAYGSIDHWAEVIDMHLDESYLYDWFKGLYVRAGMPKAKSVARDLSLGKAEPDERYWESELINYSQNRAGNEIVLVQGTFRDNLVGITRKVMEADTTMPIEKLARRIFAEYQAIELWQARRIAQTETMIGLADAGEVAARSLGIRYDKQWVISGLGNTRETHEIMDGVVVDMDEPFTLPDCQMMYPHDSSLGAPAGEIINCACDVLHLPK
jgi:hypothetical protein